MSDTCPSCGGVSTSAVGGYDHRTWCPQKYPTVSWPMTAPHIAVPPQAPPIPADGALHRCYCGAPIWFGALYNPRPDAYPQPDRIWRETDGTPHRCPKEGRDG